MIGLEDSYQDRLVLFNMHMYDEFHVPDLLIVLLHTLKGTDSIKSNPINVTVHGKTYLNAYPLDKQKR